MKTPMRVRRQQNQAYLLFLARVGSAAAVAAQSLLIRLHRLPTGAAELGYWLLQQQLIIRSSSTPWRAWEVEI